MMTLNAKINLFSWFVFLMLITHMSTETQKKKGKELRYAGPVRHINVKRNS